MGSGCIYFIICYRGVWVGVGCGVFLGFELFKVCGYSLKVISRFLKMCFS